MLRYSGNLKPYARQLRKNMTDAEIRLWSKVRMKQLNGYQFYRQKPIGNYIVDFFCPQAKLVIEVDGSQHYSDGMVDKDERRDGYMRSQGLRVLRYNDTEVLTNIEGVVYNILESLGAGEEEIPLQSPFSKGGD